MKKIIFGLLTLTSLSAFSQVITGGNGEITDTFEFKIVEYIASVSGSASFITDKNNYGSSIHCTGEPGSIRYTNSEGKGIKFEFSYLDNCEIIRACIRKLQSGETIKIQVNRVDRKIIKVVMPDSCTLDPWGEP